MTDDDGLNCSRDPQSGAGNRPIAPWSETRVVGKPLPRVDASDRVSGTAVFPRDVSLPGMLHAAVLRCPYPHAIVKRVDIGEAERMPGVRALVTKEYPETDLVIPYPWWIAEGPPLRLFDPHCRYAGEEVAAVAADTVYQAWDALRAIKVEYQQLPFNLDMDRALAQGVPAVHDGGNLVRPPSVYRRGDIAKGLAEADAVVEEEFRTSCEVHTPLETHGCVAQWDGSRLTVWESSQGVFDQQRDLARALGLPLGSVRIIGL
jgi:CO/xanthine dehydrogenase Mo-binding subunit